MAGVRTVGQCVLMTELMGEFMELQIQQLSLATLVAHSWWRLDSWKIGMERSKHDRDEHHGKWDHVGALEHERQIVREANELQNEFNNNQKHLRELKDQVVALMAAIAESS